MAYFTSIVENLAVLCNPVWMVDANRKWMESTQQLIITYQRIEAFTNQNNVLNRSDISDQQRSTTGGTLKNDRRLSDTNCTYAVSHEEWREREKEAAVSSLDQMETKCADDKLSGSSAWQPDISPPHVSSSSNASPRDSNKSSSPVLESTNSEQQCTPKKYCLFESSPWLDFPKMDSFLSPAGWLPSETSHCRPEPCRNDPAAWAGWMLQQQTPAYDGHQFVRKQKPTTPDISGELLRPATDSELQGISDLVLKRASGTERQLLTALQASELRQLWDPSDRGAATRWSCDGSEGSEGVRNPADSEHSYAANPVGRERPDWPPEGARCPGRGRAWNVPQRPAEIAAEVERRGGAVRGLPAPEGGAQPAASGAASDLDYPTSSYALVATHASQALLSAPAVPQRPSSAGPLLVSQAPLKMAAITVTGAAQRMVDGNRGAAHPGTPWPVVTERQIGWYHAGWPLPQQQAGATSHYALQESGVPPQHSQQKVVASSQFFPQKSGVCFQYLPIQCSTSSQFTLSKTIGPSQYHQQCHAFSKFSAQPSCSSQCASLSSSTASQTARSREQAAQYGKPNRAARQRSGGCGGRAGMRHSISDTSLRPVRAAAPAPAPAPAADHRQPPAGSPRAAAAVAARCGRSTFEDFLRLLGVSDGNTTDLVELWRIGQVGGSSGPPSTELSPRSDSLTPTAAASTPREPPAAAAAPPLRRTKSLGSLPAASGRHPSVSSSSSRDSVTRRFDELEFLAIEQYESSDSLSRRFSDLERQALEQYALISQQASREALAAAGSQRAAPVPAPAAVPPAAVHRGASGRSGAGKPRKRRGKKKARELVADTCLSSGGAWRAAGARPSSAGGCRSGWVLDDKSAQRPPWVGPAPCATQGDAAAQTGAAAAAYPTLPPPDAAFRGYPAANADLPPSFSAPQGMRLPPPPFAAEPARPSLPAGMLNVGQLAPQAARQALAQAARLPGSPLLWPSAFPAGGRREAGSGQSGRPRQDTAGAEDADTSCVLQ